MTFDEWAKNRWDDSPELDYKLDDLKAAYDAYAKGSKNGTHKAN